MSDLIDWGYLTELYRETDKPIRKDENVFYEFSSAVFANFKHILKERETQAERLAELEAEVARLRVGHDRYEIVRRMSSRRFEAMFNESISTDKRFDDLVDAAKESA